MVGHHPIIGHGESWWKVFSSIGCVDSFSLDNPHQRNIGFTSAVGSNTRFPGYDQTIVYDHIVTNVGNGFDPYTGVFGADKAGTYVFAISARSGSTAYYTTLELVHRGNVLCRAYASATDTDQGGCVAVVHLQPGDHVMVRHMHGAGDVLTNNYYNVFSGFLITSEYKNYRICNHCRQTSKQEKQHTT